MGCIRSLSKILARWTAVGVVFVNLLFPVELWAAFASQFSLGVGEQYNDNIFFAKAKEHDFITTFIPTLSFFYAPPGEVAPTGSLSITPNGQIYARHSELNNFGDNISVNGTYAYRYSPKLSFSLSETLARQGDTRVGGLGEPVQLSGGPTTSLPGSSTSQHLKDLISQGDQFSNSFSFQGGYLFRPDINFTGFYSNTFTKFIDAGGTDVFHTVGARGIYNWRRDHNLHAGYSISINNSRNGESGVVHNFDFGDDYFSNYNLQLSPTLSLTASTGLSFNAGSDGPRIGNNTNITLTKLWEVAVLNVGFTKGLTPSFGVSGISDTTSLFTNFGMRFTERLSTNANVNLSFFDTEDVNFKTFQAGIGLRYMMTSWLSSALNYQFNWINSGAGASRTDLLNKGTVSSNTILLTLTSYFDLWPNTGLARSLTSPTLTTVLKTPFPVQSPPSSQVSP
jgi:hypothetical protein